MEHEEEECPHPPSSSVEDGCPHGVVKTGLTRCDRYPLTQVLSRPLTSTMSVFRVTIKFDIIIIAITCLVDRKNPITLIFLEGFIYIYIYFIAEDIYLIAYIHIYVRCNKEKNQMRYVAWC